MRLVIDVMQRNPATNTDKAQEAVSTPNLVPPGAPPSVSKPVGQSSRRHPDATVGRALDAKTGRRLGEPSSFRRIYRLAELASFLAVAVAAPLAYLEYRNNVNKEESALAERVYHDVDERFLEYIKLCLEHPRLDGYSVPRAGKLVPPLSEDEKTQQKLLYTALTDTLEVAYVQYHKTEAVPEKVRKSFHDKQWPGWDAYIRKFLARPAYRKTWFEIRDEYDQDFASYMDKIAPPPKKQ